MSTSSPQNSGMRPLMVFEPMDGQDLTREELEPYVGKLDGSLVDVTYRYLASGTTIFAWMGFSPDVVADEFDSSPLVMSDGVYYWRRWAADYVWYHSVALPQDFIDRCVERAGVPRSLSHDEVVALHSMIDSEFRSVIERKRALFADGPPPIDQLC